MKPSISIKYYENVICISFYAEVLAIIQTKKTQKSKFREIEELPQYLLLTKHVTVTHLGERYINNFQTNEKFQVFPLHNKKKTNNPISTSHNSCRCLDRIVTIRCY